MTLTHLTRSLLFASVLLLGGAAAVAADEPDNGLLGDALGGAADLVEGGAGAVTGLPVVEDLPVPPVVDTAETVVTPATKPVEQVVAPAVETVVEPAPPVLKPVATVVAPVVKAVVEPVAPVAEPVVAVLAPATEGAAPVVEPIVKPAVPALRPVAQPVQDVAPVTKIVVDSIAAPIADAIAPIVESIAPAVVPLVPIVDTVTEVVGPVADPIVGTLPPVVDPVGVGKVLDPVLRPNPGTVPSSAVGSPDQAVTSPPHPTTAMPRVVIGRSAGQIGFMGGDVTPTVLEPASPVGGHDTAASRHARAKGTTASPTPAPLQHAPTPLAAVLGELVGSAPDGGFSIVLLAAMALAVIASRSSVNAAWIARPPSLTFAPAVPPA